MIPKLLTVPATADILVAAGMAPVFSGTTLVN